jgi:WD40 repeat protein
MSPALSLLVAATALAPAGVPRADARLKDLGVEMVLDTPGRTGACDVLRFTADGRQLLAAGDDKVVRVWDCGAGGLTPAAVPRLRWSIFREHRGGIYASDIVPDPIDGNGFRVAVAGAGVRQGAVAILDSRGKVLYGLPHFAAGRQEDEARTLQAVWSVAFAPGGDAVAFGGSDGSVWLWHLVKKEIRFLGRHAGGDGGRPGAFNEVRLVAFPAKDKLLSVAADGWVLEWDVGAEAPGPRRVFRFQTVHNLACVALDRTRQWLAAGGQTFAEGERSSLVELRSLDGGRRKALALPRRNFPKCLAFDAASRRLAVGTYRTSEPPGFYLLLGGGTYLFNLADGEPLAAAGPDTSNYVDALAFHPDGMRLAVSGGDDHDVTLWDLTRPGVPAVARIVGPGHGLWGAGVSKDFRYLGYRDRGAAAPNHPNHPGGGEWRVFDLKKRCYAPEAEAREFRPVAPLDRADGWSVEPDALDGTIWYVAKGTTRHRVPLMPLDKFPRCYTFLKADEDHPTRLVVGHLWGMSVFALGNGPPRLVRKFAGHQGEVMAVAPSADGKFLVSASRDQTVAVWSLLPQNHQDELGAAFDVRAERLVVKDVAPGSPAWEARLEPGDEVTEFANDGRWLREGPGAWLSVLRDPPPGRECAFRFDRGGAPFATLTTVRQRPLARFFPIDGREWVLWRYYDFYYDCSANGDRFLGWQLSGDVGDTPRFDPLERYRKRFFRPEKVETLFADVGAGPERVSLTDVEPPRLAFDASPDRLAGGAVRLSISARPSGERPEHRLKQVNLWVNGAVVREWPVYDSGELNFLTFYDLPAEQLRRGTNVLTVQAYNRADVRRQAEARVRYDKPETPANLYGLVIGVGDYNQSPAGLQPLSANKDALAVGKLLEGEKQLFASTRVVLLRDQDASRERILEELDRLAKLVRPDDTFVLFLGGHGASGRVINTEVAAEASRRGVGLDKVSPHLFVFCTHDFALEKPLATGLPSEDLYRQIRRLNCRSLVLLDACHSGTVVEDPVRQLTPEGVGPVILSACEPREQAAESRLLGLQYAQGRADGLFTIALLLATEREFQRADANHDRVLTAAELNDYLRRRVSALLQARAGDAPAQHPTGSLPEMERDMPLAAR